MKDYYEYYNPVTVVAGINGVQNELARELHYMNAKRVLLLSDTGLNKLGVVDKVTQAIEAGETRVDGIFIDIVEVEADCIDHICDIYSFNSCDSIVAVGGGSVINTAKAVKMVLSQGVGSIRKLLGYDVVKKGRSLPLVVIPTTSGYGTEMSNSIFVKMPNGEYTSIISQELYVTETFLDAVMLETLPAERMLLFAYNAMSQIIESVCSVKHTPITNRHASFAISRITRSIADCITSDCDNMSARQSLLEASSLSGVAASNNMRGAIFSIAKAISIVTNIGASYCLPKVLPVVLRKNINVCREQYETLLYYLVGSEEFSRIEDDDRAEYFITAFMNWFDALSEKVGYKSKPLVLTGEQVAEIINRAYFDCASLANPIKVTKRYIFEILAEIMAERV